MICNITMLQAQAPGQAHERHEKAVTTDVAQLEAGDFQHLHVIAATAALQAVSRRNTMITQVVPYQMLAGA